MKTNYSRGHGISNLSEDLHLYPHAHAWRLSAGAEPPRVSMPVDSLELEFSLREFQEGRPVGAWSMPAAVLAEGDVAVD
jgi:hypothetical protein